MVFSKWTAEITSKFITLYREQECLWRIDSLTYRDRNARNTALTNIITGMEIQDLTIDDVKKKIKYLRSTYMGEVNKIEKSQRSGAGTSTVYKPSLTWFQDMDAFIKYVNVKRNTQSSFIAQQNPETNSESNENTMCDTNKETDVGVDTNNETDADADTNKENMTNVANKELNSFRKQKRNAPADETNAKTKRIDSNQSPQTGVKGSRINKLCSAVKDMQSISQDIFNNTEESNEFDIYGKYVGAQLKSMNERDAILAQEEIQSILTRYKLKKIQTDQDNATPTSRISNYQSLLSRDGSNNQSCNSDEILREHSYF